MGTGSGAEQAAPPLLLMKKPFSGQDKRTVPLSSVPLSSPVFVSAKKKRRTLCSAEGGGAGQSQRIRQFRLTQYPFSCSSRMDRVSSPRL